MRKVLEFCFHFSTSQTVYSQKWVPFQFAGPDKHINRKSESCKTVTLIQLRIRFLNELCKHDLQQLANFTAHDLQQLANFTAHPLLWFCMCTSAHAFSRALSLLSHPNPAFRIRTGRLLRTI
jgi:hypothetical protein